MVQLYMQFLTRSLVLRFAKYRTTPHVVDLSAGAQDSVLTASVTAVTAAEAMSRLRVHNKNGAEEYFSNNTYRLTAA